MAFVDIVFVSLIFFICLCIRQYVGKADFLVFRAMSQHGFLGQLQDKKLVSFVVILRYLSDIPTYFTRLFKFNNKRI